MSCSSCNCNPCACSCCDASCEPLSSALDNFIDAFFGDLTKTCVDGKVVWTLPCNLESGLACNPRLEDEGLACYFLRLWQSGFTGTKTRIEDVTYSQVTGTMSKVVATDTYCAGILIGSTTETVEIFTGVPCVT